MGRKAKKRRKTQGTASRTRQGTGSRVRNHTGSTPLHFAVASNDLHTIEHLLGRGIDVNVLTPKGETPMHLAALFNRVDAMKTLKSHGGDITAQDYEGWTPLYSAILSLVHKEENPLAALEWLIAQEYKDTAKIDLNVQCFKGRTPMHLAAYMNSVEAMEFLVNHGANINIPDFAKITPMDLAISFGATNATKWLKLKSDEITENPKTAQETDSKFQNHRFDQNTIHVQSS